MGTGRSFKFDIAKFDRGKFDSYTDNPSKARWPKRRNNPSRIRKALKPS